MFCCMTLGQMMLKTWLYFIPRKKKVRLETRIRRRRGGTREHSRCYMVSRYKAKAVVVVSTKKNNFIMLKEDICHVRDALSNGVFFSWWKDRNNEASFVCYVLFITSDQKRNNFDWHCACVPIACHGKDRCRLRQPPGIVQEQQQEAGSCKILQFPGPQEAASHWSHPVWTLQWHHRHRWTKIPPYLDIGRTDKHSACNRHTFIITKLFPSFLILFSCPFFSREGEGIVGNGLETF